MHPQIKIVGETSDGTIRAIAVAQDGSLVTSGGGGGGAGGGDASAANQQVQTSLLEIIRDRLSSITTATDTLESLIISLNSYVDGLEGLLTSANTTSTAISGFVDQLEGYTDGIEANQGTQTSRLTEIRDRLPASGNGAATIGVSVTPNDTLAFAPTKGIFVGNSGNLAVLFTGDTNPVTFNNIASGSILPFNCQRVMATGTTASNIIALR